jgi:cytochrome c oxidase assembly factor CtaG
VSWRRPVSAAARVAAVAVILAAASGRLPHLVVVHAAITAFLSMVAAPLWLLDRTGRDADRRPRRGIPAFPAVTLMALGTNAVQLPAAARLLSDGGLLTALVLAVLLAGSLAFWSVVVPPARIKGLAACGYVVIGGVPISLPSMFLILSPRDIYSAFHAASPPAIGALNDQLYAGFILFAAVKISIWVVGSCVFFAAAAESAAADDGDDGGRPVPVEPRLPDWVMELSADSPTVDEPAVAAVGERETETAGAR